MSPHQGQVVYIRSRAEWADDPHPIHQEGWPSRYHSRQDCPAIVTAEGRTQQDIRTLPIPLAAAVAGGWLPCRRCVEQ